jgi:hypothetical protein
MATDGPEVDDGQPGVWDPLATWLAWMAAMSVVRAGMMA